LIDRADLAALQPWDVAPEGLPKAMTRLLSDPRFDAAARTLAANMLAASDDNRVVDGVFKDAGRYVVTLWAMYLHATEGLTLPRLKAICAASSFLSAGRARSLLQYLIHLGCVRPVSPARAGVAAVYAPTPWFEALWAGHLKAALAAAAVIEPAAGAALAHIEADPAAMTAFLAHHAEGLLKLVEATPMDGPDPFNDVIMARHAGNQVVMILLTAGEPGVFAGDVGEPVVISVLARRLAVSRIHLARLFAAAEGEGLLARHRGGVRIPEAMRQRLGFHYAMQLQQLLGAAARALSGRPVGLGAGRA
jgi:hypothetical protein